MKDDEEREAAAPPASPPERRKSSLRKRLTTIQKIELFKDDDLPKPQPAKKQQRFNRRMTVAVQNHGGLDSFLAQRAPAEERKHPPGAVMKRGFSDKVNSKVSSSVQGFAELQELEDAQMQQDKQQVHASTLKL